jgi:mRNA-degrading endonuclease toxin of MazEF toxin-antitoxin module
MTSYSRGGIQRPGLIVSTARYHQGRHETILAAITSNVGRILVGDYKIKAWRESGLLHPSIVTGIVRTIKHEMIASKMGELPGSELQAVGDKLREVMAL